MIFGQSNISFYFNKSKIVLGEVPNGDKWKRKMTNLGIQCSYVLISRFRRTSVSISVRLSKLTFVWNRNLYDFSQKARHVAIFLPKTFFVFVLFDYELLRFVHDLIEVIRF